MNLIPFLQQPSCFVLLLAPPGWGKTSLLLDMYRENAIHLVFVSPLRALANEFYERAREMGRVYLIEKRADCQKIGETFFSKNYGLLVVTPETLNDDFFSLSEAQEIKPIFVLDEFHLYYYWGDSFRPRLWECCMGIANTGSSLLGLTATIEESLLERWKEDFKIAVEENYLIDLGNRRLKSLPTEHLDFSYIGIKSFNLHFIRELRKNMNKTYLYFCQYRSQVDAWMRFCKREEIEAVACKGGEVPEFLKAIEECPKPRCIFSTTALSHGVNLPEISKVFLSYPIESHDFWLQMAGRGGRQGNPYQVYSFGDKETTWKKRLIDSMKLFRRLFKLF